jgi:hypothetical protein
MRGVQPRLRHVRGTQWLLREMCLKSTKHCLPASAARERFGGMWEQQPELHLPRFILPRGLRKCCQRRQVPGLSQGHDGYTYQGFRHLKQHLLLPSMRGDILHKLRFGSS